VLFIRIQLILGQKEAIGAINIAGGAARLRQEMEAGRGVGRQIFVSHQGHI
jgi:hypothetical protein